MRRGRSPPSSSRLLLPPPPSTYVFQATDKKNSEYLLENSDKLTICSNAEFPGESVTEGAPSELCVKE